jgi:hypothetical protein
MTLHIPIVDVDTQAYCGPTAISSIANVPVSKVRSMVQRMRGRDRAGRRRAIRGMCNSEMLRIMARLGRKPQLLGNTHGMTLGQLCADIGHYGPFIVNVTGHYVALSHGMICDTHTKVPVPIAQYKKLRTRVQYVWQLEAVECVA